MQTIKYRRPWLYKKQEAAIFHRTRFGLIEASTKAGKTAGCMLWLVERALLGKPRENRWWVAPVYSQTEIAYQRFKHALRALPIKPRENPPQILLPNGGMLWFKSAEKPDNLYGEDVYDAVLDEASRMREEAFHALRSTLTATRGNMRLIGNVKGRQNFFYRMCRKAEAGEPDMEYHKLTAYDAVEGGILEMAEIEAAKRELPEDVFRELYLAEPADDGGNPFGIKSIEACVGALSTKAPKWWGWDLAKSSDWTVGVAIDEDGAVCRFERFQKPWMQTMPIIFEATGQQQAMVDSTGVGDPIVEQLQAKGNNYEGYKFSSASKQQLMEGLALAIQQKKIRYPEGIIKNELMSYEYEYTRTGVRYTAPEGMHDDCVCALALAQRRRTVQVAGMGILDYYEGEYNDLQAKQEKDDNLLFPKVG